MHLLEKFEAAGIQVALVRGNKIERPPLSADGILMTLEGDNIQVFEYSSSIFASKEANDFLESYGQASKNRMSWTPTAHLYLESSLIVLYTGNRDEVVSSLDRALGSPLAVDN
jgi:hypothetical protein